MSVSSNPKISISPTTARRPLGSTLLLAASAALFVGAVVNGFGYLTASIAIRNSGLVPHLQNAFRGLWLAQSLQAVVISGVLLLAALRPGSIAKAAILLCALLPLLSGALVAVFLSSVLHRLFPGLAAGLTLLGVLLQPSTPESSATGVP
jgi:hypothetical protein